MKVLITGSAGLLAKYLMDTAPEGVRAVGSYHLYCPNPAIDMDITNPHRVYAVFKTIKPDVVIHTAAIGDVDKAQKDPEGARKINIEGTINIIEKCKETGCKLVFLSTNAVFSGNNPPYSETDECHPVNEYGKIKLEAEGLVKECPEWVIIRPIMLYGWPYINSRGNFVSRVLYKLVRGEKIQAVNDTMTQPTYAGDAAEAIWGLLEKNGEIYHVAAEEQMTLYSLAVRAAGVFGLNEQLIEPVPSNYFPTIAPRPKDTTYCLGKINSLGIKCGDIFSGLRKMKEEK